MTPSQATPKRNPAFDQRRLQLLHAAAGVFSTEGYDRASMRRIAAASGLSLSGVYHYVSGKQELLYWIQLDTFVSLIRGLQDSLVGLVDPRERLLAAVGNHVRHFGEHLHELKVCARELETLEGEAHEEVYVQRRAYFQAIQALVEALPARQADPLDSWLATANLFGMLNWFYQWYDPGRSTVSLDDLAAQQTALFLGGYSGNAGGGVQ